MLLTILRVIITALWVGVSCIIGMLSAIIQPFDPKSTTLATHLFGWGHHLLGIELEIRNEDILDSFRPCVFISNHQHNLDIVMGGTVFPKQTVTIGKKSLFFVPLFGQFFWIAGNLFIDRKNKKRAFATMDVATKAIQEKKLSLWIMPEGTRSNGRGLLPFKKGAFVTAIKAQVPIVPIVISSYTQSLKLNKWHAGKIIIQILPPIPTKNLTLRDADSVKNIAFTNIQETLLKLDAEIAEEELKKREFFHE